MGFTIPSAHFNRPPRRRPGAVIFAPPPGRPGRGSSERLANVFAAELLMPKPIVVSKWAEYKNEPTLYRVRLVAFSMGVSIEAAKVRLKEVGLIEKTKW